MVFFYIYKKSKLFLGRKDFCGIVYKLGRELWDIDVMSCYQDRMGFLVLWLFFNYICFCKQKQ